MIIGKANRFFGFIVLMTFMAACTTSERHHDLKINLRWVKGYATENKTQVMTGVQWSLSFLGATLPLESEQAFDWKNETQLEIDFSKVGFSDTAQRALAQIISTIKQSEEYQHHNSVDLGRFIMLTLCSSNHYYAITGTKKNYDGFRKEFSFADTLGAIVESGVAKGNRLIEISHGHDRHAFVALEGQGSLHDSTFRTEEFEVFDIMPNGQLRFAIYNGDGNLKSAGSSALTDAGKPAKCLWCHEINIQPLFFNKTDIPGHYTTQRFEKILSEKINDVNQYRKTLASLIDFTKRQDHTQAELLYLSFMEPSAERLASEWKMDIVSVKEKLKSLPTHAHEEFSFLGEQLYRRKDVDKLAPFGVVRVPDSAREYSEYEPDLVQ